MLLGFVAKTASSYYLAQCVEKMAVNVTFQSGALELHVSVLKISMCWMGALARVMATVMKRDVITAMNSVSRFLARKPGVQLRFATGKSTPKVTVSATAVSLAMHT